MKFFAFALFRCMRGGIREAMRRTILGAMLGLTVLMGLSCFPFQVGAEELEIEKESDGIHIIQKRPRMEAIPEQGGVAVEPEGAPGPAEPGGEAGPGEGGRPGAGPEAGPGRLQGPPSGPGAPPEGTPENEAKKQEDLSFLNKEYNRRLDRLQQEADRQTDAYNQRMDSLQRQVNSMEEVMVQAERNFERERFLQYQENTILLRKRMEEENRRWQRTKQQLLKRKQQLNDWHAQQLKEINQRYK